MTQDEYLKKRAMYMTSDAPQDVRDAAIAKLDAEYNVTDAASLALEDYHASAADLDDVGN